MVKFLVMGATYDTYFFTMFTRDRKPFFEEPELCELVMLGIELTMEYHGFFLDAYCILPDHVHLLITLPERVYTYSIILVDIRFVVTRLFKYHFNKPNLILWQDKFLIYNLQDPFDGQKHLDFIHYNPIQHGYIDNIDKWPWSSIDLESDDRDIKTRLYWINELSERAYLTAE